MTKALARVALMTGLAVAVSFGLSHAALAGGSGLDDHDDEDAGTPFFGFVKDVTRGGTVADAKVVAEIKGGNASLVTRTDAQGIFRISGFGKDVDPANVEITCSKEAYKMTIAMRRGGGSGEPGKPIEVDCLLAKQ
jgi:hypothetical protein